VDPFGDAHGVTPSTLALAIGVATAIQSSGASVGARTSDRVNGRESDSLYRRHDAPISLEQL
jgi:hypothetical protein